MKLRYLFIGVATLVAWNTWAANPHPEISRYHVKLIPDLETKSIAGTTEIFLRRTFAQPQALHFPLNELQVDQIKSGSTSVSYSTDKGILSFEVPPNSQSVEIQYRGTPTKGLNFGPSSVYSSYFTCNWMICREEPGEKALFSIELTLPQDLKVVASGEEVKTTALPNGRTLHSWMQRRPYSTYLFGFAVGRFNETKSKIGSTKLLVLSEVYESAKLAKLFQDTGRMVQFFETKSGVPFPHKKYAQILVENSEAQENSSFSVIGKEEIDPLLTDPKEDWVIAHELSHQWWGNLITCRTWQHVWLNEGMTVFMVAAYKEKRWGKAAYEKELKIAKKRWDRAIEANFDVPLAYSKEYPSLRIMRAIVYSKAAIFFDQLRQTMGEKNFWKGIRAYSQKFAGKSVESHDFELVMQKMTAKDLTPLFKNWVYESEK